MHDFGKAKERINSRLYTPSSTPRDEQNNWLACFNCVIFCIVSILLTIGIVSLVYQTEQRRSRKIRENYTSANDRPADISPDLEKSLQINMYGATIIGAETVPCGPRNAWIGKAKRIVKCFNKDGIEASISLCPVASKPIDEIEIPPPPTICP